MRVISFTVLFCLIHVAIGQSLDHVAGQFLVMLKPSANLESVLKTPVPGVRTETFFKEERLLSARLRTHLISVDPTKVNEASALRLLQGHSSVLLAQYNHYIKERKTLNTYPNDPNFANQWDMENTGQGNGLVDADIDAPEAWDITTGGLTLLGDTVVVAVIDNGFDLGHQDLNLWKNHAEIPNNGIDDDQNGYIDDYDGWSAYGSNGSLPVANHGTHVSGTVSAKGDNGIGVVGVNWDAQVMPIAGSSGQEATVVEAYGYALEMRARYNQSNGAEGAFVVSTNSSFGVDFADPANFPIWCAFFDSLGAVGILSAGATMNNGSNVDVTGDVPTACASPWLISVTNSTRQDQRNNGAAFGLTTIDLAAPGTGILSTLPGDSYGALTGTSMATPHVAGAVGLLISGACPALLEEYRIDPAGTALLFRDYLFQGVDTLPQLTGELLTGGRLNVHKSLLMMDTACAQLGACPAVLDAAVIGLLTDSSAQIQWTAQDSALQYQLRYRVVGDSVWLTTLSAFDSTFLAGLQGCTAYELQVQSLCTNDSSGYFQSLTFVTEGCCEAPAQIIAGATQDSGLQVAWLPVYGADSYTIRYRETGDTLWAETTVMDTAGWLSTLEPCQGYEVQVQTNCPGIKQDFSPTQLFYTTGCAACVEMDYCEIEAPSTSLGFLDTIQIGNLFSSTGDDSGYGNFAFYGVDLQSRDSFAVHLVPGSAGIQGDYMYRVWVDLNQDGDFEDQDEMLFETGPTPDPVSAMAWMPEAPSTGIYRMRITMQLSGGSSTFPASCEAISFGETEDYCLKLQVPCDVPESLQVFKRYDDSGLVDVYWNSENQADQYQLTLVNQIDSSQQFFYSDSTSLQIGPFPTCTEYGISIKSICGSDTSEASEARYFTSLGCGACIDPPYCPHKGVNSSTFITMVGMDSWQHSSADDNGYGDFTGIGPSLPRGEQVSLTLASGPNGTDSVNWRIWADWNQDGDFEDAGELAFEPGQASIDTLTDLFTVPANAVLGQTRLRVSAEVGGISSSCGSILVGETQDYCLDIMPATFIHAQDEFDLQLYPNPGPGQFTLESELPVRYVRLLNLQGQPIREHAGASRMRLELTYPGIPPGVYLLEVHTPLGTSVIRLINQSQR